MARVITTEHPTRDARRFLRYWTEPAHVEPRVRGLHPQLSARQERTKAREVAVSVAQGLEFIEGSDGASVLTRPLSLFYGTENLAKALCLYLAPGTRTASFGHHGLVGDRNRRYFIRNLTCRTAGSGTNVWSNLVSVFNADRVRLQYRHDQHGSMLRDWRFEHGAAIPKKGTVLKLGDLLRCLPELTEDVGPAGWGTPYSVHVVSFRIRSVSGPPEQTSAEMTLRHGHDDRVRTMIRAHDRSLLKNWKLKEERFDVLQYEWPLAPKRLTGPNLRLDVSGEPYADFSRGRYFGEFVTYFASLFILSDAVRYHPEQWLRLLNDHPGEAILIDRFLDVATRKVPHLALNELRNELLVFRYAR